MIEKNRAGLLVIFIIYAIFSVVSLVTLNPHLDERESHLPTVKNFYENDIITAIEGGGYKSASTPLPYLIVSVPLKLFNVKPSLFAARSFNIIVSLITLLLFTFLFRGQNKNFIYPVLILFFYPYFLKPSFAFFMSIYGLMFFLLFIYLTEKKSNGSIFLAGLSLAAAVLSQQFYLVVFAFHSGYLLYKEYKPGLTSKSVLRLLYFLLPLILPFAVFLIWGGLVHHAYRAWGAAFSVYGLTGVLVTLGAVLLPYLVFNIREITLQGLMFLLFLSVLLVLFAFPLWVNQPAVGGIPGITFNFLSKINHLSIVLSFILKTFFCFLGMASFIIFYKKVNDDKTGLIFLLFIALAIGFTINKLPSERHMLPLIATAFLFIFNQVNKKVILKYWLAYQVIIGSVYFYYIMFAYPLVV